MLSGDFRIEDMLSFKNWLIDNRSKRNGGLSNIQVATVNAISLGAKAFIRWLVLHTKECGADQLNHRLSLVDDNWSTHAVLPTRTVRQAKDYEADEISEIERFFVYQAFRKDDHKARNGVRNYLIWRLAIEYGLRIGEILALRVQDLPSERKPYLEVVRIEHRNDGADPRGTNAPKAKTLGRELGQYFQNSRFPELFSIYRSSERWAWAKRKSGRRYQKTSFSHPYLLITNSGAPLSMSSAQAIAQSVKSATSIDFRWHRARHTFFNRAYEKMLEIEDPHQRRIRLDGLMYMGGWSSEESLSIYAAAAQRKSARSASYDLQSQLV
jgi:integrase